MSTHETELSRQDEELVALGCHPCLAHHLNAAKKADLTEFECERRSPAPSS